MRIQAKLGNLINNLLMALNPDMEMTLIMESSFIEVDQLFYGTP